jgi:hypothetical protein
MDFHCRSLLAISLLLTSNTLSLQAQPLEPGPTPTTSQPSSQAAASAYGRLPLTFVKNQGQFDERARFVARQGAVTTYCTREGFVLQLVTRERQEGSEEDCVTGANVFFTFEGASSEARVQGLEELPGRFNYFRGQDPAQWHTDVPTYQKIHYQDLYPDIDLELREGEPGRLDYDLILMPGADIESVRVRCEGGESLALDDQGALVLETTAGVLREPRPVTYQIGLSGEMIAVDCSFRIVDDTHFGFEARSWDRQAPLVIDPGLVYSTFLGGTSGDAAQAIAVDSAGAAYLAGSTASSGFPTTAGAFDTSYNYFGATDAFVTKLDASGTALVYSTFLGGTDGDGASAIAVNSAGAAYVAGSTVSSDFPTTPGAVDTSYNGGADDAFVTKLNASGSALLYSTFLGGTDWDSALAIAVDSAGAAYVAGDTYSSDFPTTPGAFDTSFNGQYTDAFVTKLDASGSALVYSTFLGGGTGTDEANAIAVDSAGAAYVVGYTDSSDFPTTPGAFDTSYGGGVNGGDAFVAKVDASGSALGYSTFLGGTSGEAATAIAVDSAGATYVAGDTLSYDFPTTPGAFDTSYNGGDDAFVTKLDASGSALVYSTFLGGTNVDNADAIAVDSAGAAFAAGWTKSSDFPTTPGAFDTSYSGGVYGGDAFVTKLDASGSALVYSTFLGGKNDDYAYAIAVDSAGAAYVAGYTSSSDFPTTPGAFDTSWNGGYYDAFVTKLDIDYCLPATWSNYGAGWPGTLGTPSLTSSANPSLGSTITLSIGNSLGANTTGFLAIGLTQASLTTCFGGTLLLLPISIITIRIPATGLSVPGPIPKGDASWCGLAIFLQVMEFDAGASKGVSFTPGLELDLGI